MTNGPRDVLLAIGFGWVAGMRTMAAPALLSGRLANEPRMDRIWPECTLASPGRARMLKGAAVGELAADKLPWIPPRTRLLPLAGRMASGAFTAAASAAHRRSPRLPAAVLGAASAGIASYAMRNLRRRASRHGVSNGLAGAAEDALTLALGARVLAIEGRRRGTPADV